MLDNALPIFSHKVRDTAQVVELLRQTPAAKEALAGRDAELVNDRRGLVSELRKLERDAEREAPKLAAALEAATTSLLDAEKALASARARLTAVQGRRSAASAEYDGARQRIEVLLREGADNDAIDGFRCDMLDELELTRKLIAAIEVTLPNRVTGRSVRETRSNSASVNARCQSIMRAMEAADALRLEPDQRLVPQSWPSCALACRRSNSCRWGRSHDGFVAPRRLGEPSVNGRIIRYRLSNSSAARDGHRIMTSGWDLQNFKCNPIWCWQHDTSEPPIGKVIEIGAVGDWLMASVEFADADTYPFADTIYRLTQAGILNAASVQWLPIDWAYATDRNREPGAIDFLRQELLEASSVCVGTLPTALVTARGAGIDTGPFRAWAERQLDSGVAAKSSLPRKELEMVRSAARMPAATISQPRMTTPRVEPVVRSSETRFASLGENLRAIAQARTQHVIDSRLVRAPDGLNEADPTLGGFLVETQWSQELAALAYEESVIAQLCDRRPTDFPLADIRVPGIDETSRADGSRWGGALAYWAAEAVQVAGTFPRLSSSRSAQKADRAGDRHGRADAGRAAVRRAYPPHLRARNGVQARCRDRQRQRRRRSRGDPQLPGADHGRARSRPGRRHDRR